MAKGKKSRNTQKKSSQPKKSKPTATQVILFTTAIINLLNAIFNLTDKLW